MARGPLNLVGIYTHALGNEALPTDGRNGVFLGDELYQYKINLQCLKD
jgi:hypothetical protein